MTDTVEPQSREEIYLKSSHQYIGALTNIEQRLVPKKAFPMWGSGRSWWWVLRGAKLWDLNRRSPNMAK